VEAGAGVAEVAGAAGAAGGVVDFVVAAEVGAESVAEDGEWRAGALAGWGTTIAAGDDIISCMGDGSFFVTESAIEWSKGPVKVMSKPVAVYLLHLLGTKVLYTTSYRITSNRTGPLPSGS
jgi:hypothetical protein